MSGRSITFVVVGTIIVSSIILANIERSSNKIGAILYSYFYRQTAQNIAQSGVNMGIRQFTKNPDWRTGFSTMNFFGGCVQIKAFDTTFGGVPVVAVRAFAQGSSNLNAVRSAGVIAYGTARETTSTSTVYLRNRLAPPSFQAVLLANATTTISGDLVLDGRDHTTGGALVANQGTYGVRTSSTFAQGGTAEVGGTVSGVDYAPQTSGNNPQGIMQGAPTMGPTTPDSVFGGMSYGYPEGTLKTIAQSGAAGSQYCTDPSSLKYPLAGVTYVELPSGQSWSNAGVSGSGVLVVHNSSRNARIANVLGWFGFSSFKGIVIADDINRINGNILGAVVTLTSSPASGYIMGESYGNILYSKAAIKSAADFTKTAGGVVALAWYE